MSINRLFDTIEQVREAAHWRAAFGEPYTVEDKTIIPVAQVAYGFGLGFGSGSEPPETGGEPTSTGEGAGGGGGVSSKALGALVISPDGVCFEEVRDDSKIAMFAIGMAAFSVLQFAKTLRAVFGRK